MPPALPGAGGTRQPLGRSDSGSRRSGGTVRQSASPSHPARSAASSRGGGGGKGSGSGSASGKASGASGQRPRDDVKAMQARCDGNQRRIAAAAAEVKVLTADTAQKEALADVYTEEIAQCRRQVHGIARLARALAARATHTDSLTREERVQLCAMLENTLGRAPSVDETSAAHVIHEILHVDDATATLEPDALLHHEAENDSQSAAGTPSHVGGTTAATAATAATAPAAAPATAPATANGTVAGAPPSPAASPTSPLFTANGKGRPQYSVWAGSEVEAAVRATVKNVWKAEQQWKEAAARGETRLQSAGGGGGGDDDDDDDDPTAGWGGVAVAGSRALEKVGGASSLDALPPAPVAAAAPGGPAVSPSGSGSAVSAAVATGSTSQPSATSHGSVTGQHFTPPSSTMVADDAPPPSSAASPFRTSFGQLLAEGDGFSPAAAAPTPS